MNDYIKSLGGEYEGCLGMEMAKRPGSAGAGAIIEGDEDRFKMWYSEDFDVVRFRSEFKYGVQIALPAEVVKFIV
jgi:hypothetical protein